MKIVKLKIENSRPVTAVVGLQWGDEGKGKFIDFLVKQRARREKLIVARFGGGANAGHSVFFDDAQFVFHVLPSGILEKNTLNLIGAGVNIDVSSLIQEAAEVRQFAPWLRKNLYVAREANVVVPTAKLIEAVEANRRGFGGIGTTGRGIGPTYSDFYGRTDDLAVYEVLSEKTFRSRYAAIRQSHLKKLTGRYGAKIDLAKLKTAEKDFFAGIRYLRTLRHVSCPSFLNQKLQEGWQVLAEGAQGTLLDVRFGTRLDVTSSHTISAGACVGLGLAPQTVGKVLGIGKAYATRVGNGPMPTEVGGRAAFAWASSHRRRDEENLLYDINDRDALKQGIALRTKGSEYGATTGRLRRVGWLDLPLLKFAIALNGATHLGITKLDILDELKAIPVCVGYKNFKEIDMNALGGARPVYRQFKGWQKSTKGCTAYAELPKEAKIYLKFIERELGIPIAFVSTGPKRNEIIDLKKF